MIDPKHRSQTAVDRTPQIGLALGGGGARGFAHIHALQAFDDLGLKPALIAGTSIGALIGATYAAGMSGDEVEAFVRERFKSRIKLANDLMVFRTAKLPKLAGSAASKFYDLNMEKVLALLLPEEMPAHFDALQIPLQVVATDFEAQRETTFDSGALLPALAASAAMPGLFSPINRDDTLYVDGTLTNPVPFDTLKEKVDLIVAIDVCGFPRMGGKSQPKRIDVATASSHIMQQAIVRAKALGTKPDILMRPKVDGIKVHEFMKIKAVLDATLLLRETLKGELAAAIDAWQERNRT